MDITISKHAALRAAERGITEEGIKAIVGDESGSAVTIFSKTDPEAILTYDKYNGNIWAIVSNINTNNVISVRRARKKEIAFYEGKTRNRLGLL